VLIFLGAETLWIFKTRRSCHPLYLFLAKEAIKRMPLLSGLVRNLFFIRRGSKIQSGKVAEFGLSYYFRKLYYANSTKEL
jgi:hypothetical protein